MANLTKRIIDLQTTSTLGSDDYVMVDGATNGTKKYLLKDVLDEIEDIEDGTALGTGAVTTDKLAAGAVTSAKIADGAVDTTNIADDAVTAAKIADGAVGTDALAANAVTGAKIATGAVDTGNIASGAVTLDKIASDSNATSSRNGLMSSADKAKLDGFSAASNYALKSDIVGAYIFKGSVNTENDLPSTGLTVGDVYNIIAASSYGESGANVAWTGTAWDALGESFDISDGAIDTEQLANGAVTNGKLAEGAKTTISPTINAYTDPTYGSGTRQGYAVTFGNSSTTARIPQVNSDLLIDVENIPTIPEKKIGSAAVTANKIAAGAVGTEKLANSAVNTDKLATGAVSTDKIASLAVTTNKIAAGAVDNSKLANNAVGTAQIANGAVTSEKLGSDVTTAINAKAAASDVTALQEYVDEELEYKADIDGYYSQLTAGLAENLIGRGDAVPAEYLYRTAGGDADIEDGIATVSCIKGNTLVWNQMINPSMIMHVNSAYATEEMVGDVIKATSTVASAPAASFYIPEMVYPKINNHTLLCVADVKVTSSASSTTFRFGYASQGTPYNKEITSGSWKRLVTTLEVNMQSGASNNAFVYYDTNANLSVGDTVEIKNFQLFDLTLMFGAGNEPETVEEFEAMFSEPYYAYSAPKLLSVDIRGIETVGFNQYDPSNWEIDAGHGITVNSDGSIDLIQYGYQENYNNYPIPGIYDGTWHLEFDVELLSYSSGSAGLNLTLEYSDGTVQKRRILANNLIGGETHFTLDSYEGKTVTGIHFGDWAYNGHIVLSNICLNMSWSGYRNGEYEEHWSAERPIDTSSFFPTGMKKAGSVCDELYSDHVDVRVGAADASSAWVVSATSVNENGIGYVSLAVDVTGPSFIDGISSNLPISTQSFANSTQREFACNAATHTLFYRFPTTDPVTLDNALADMQDKNAECFYPLATPTTTEIDPPLNLSYKVSDFGTERIMVDETADAPQTAPVPMEVEYGINAIDTIRRLPTNYVPRKELEPKLDEKADVDGYYASMTVGAADNLTGRGDGASGQYLYRTAGGDEDIADGVANVHSIKGQTLVWNQLAPAYDSTIWRNYSNAMSSFTRDSSSNSITLTSINDSSGVKAVLLNGFDVKNGHKYYLSLNIDASNLSTTTAMFGFFRQDNGGDGRISVASGSVGKYADICSPAVATHVALKCGNATPNGESATFSNIQLFDLTLMFGAGNEPSTFEDFEALFPKAYYPYSEPTLLSVNMEGIETVGFNQWDEEWELGGISSATGENATTNTGIRSKNYIPIFPNTVYYNSFGDGSDRTNFQTRFYDADKQYIGYTQKSGASVGKNTSFTTPENARYMRFQVQYDYGTTYKGDICINLSWSGYRNGEYEEYWNFQREIPLATYFPNGMRSAGSVADELTPSKAVKRVGVVDLGTLTWTYFDTKSTFVTTSLTDRAYGSAGAGISGKYGSIGLVASSAEIDNYPDKTMLFYSTGTNVSIHVKDTSYGTDAAAFKTAMSGVMLYYALAEPTEVTIEPPLNLSYKVSDFGTEKIMVDEEADAPQSAPPIIQTAYGINATDTVRRLPTQYISHESFQQFVAALQSAVGITVTETWDENDGRYEYTVAQTGE